MNEYTENDITWLWLSRSLGTSVKLIDNLVGVNDGICDLRKKATAHELNCEGVLQQEQLTKLEKKRT